jgi:hypothetical protein
MLEPYLIAWIIGVFGLAIYLIRHYNLLNSPAATLDAESELCKRVMSALSSTNCPLCNSEAHIQSANLTEGQTKTAVLQCSNEKCGQKSLWEYSKGKWRLKAPFKFAPTKITEIQVQEPKEDIKLSFSNRKQT